MVRFGLNIKTFFMRYLGKTRSHLGNKFLYPQK